MNDDIYLFNESGYGETEIINFSERTSLNPTQTWKIIDAKDRKDWPQSERTSR